MNNQSFFGNKYIGLIDAIYPNKSLSLPFTTSSNTIRKYGVGIIFNESDKSFVITCLHIVKNTKNITVNYKEISSNKILSLRGICISFSDELDLALLLLDKYVDQAPNMSIFINSLKIDDDAVLNYVNIDGYIYDKSDISVSKVSYEKTQNIISYESVNSLNMPLMPTFKLKTSLNFSSDEDISGNSGTAVSSLSGDKIYGIISCINTKTSIMTIISSISIIRLLKEYIVYGIFNGLCSIYAKISTCALNINSKKSIWINN